MTEVNECQQNLKGKAHSHNNDRRPKKKGERRVVNSMNIY